MSAWHWRKRGSGVALDEGFANDLEEIDLELQDPNISRAIRESNADIAAGRIMPAETLLQLKPIKKKTKTTKR